MNRDQILAFAVAAALAAGATAVVLGGRGGGDVEAEDAKPEADVIRPPIDDGVKPKASPTPVEQIESKPGKLRDGGSVVWTETPLPDGGREIVTIAAPCVIPDCWLADGGWDDTARVDCEWTGHLGAPDGGRRWRGCNAGPAAGSVGTQCRPVACSVFAGDVETEVLR